MQVARADEFCYTCECETRYRLVFAFRVGVVALRLLCASAFAADKGLLGTLRYLFMHVHCRSKSKQTRCQPRLLI